MTRKQLIQLLFFHIRWRFYQTKIHSDAIIEI